MIGVKENLEEKEVELEALVGVSCLVIQHYLARMRPKERQRGGYWQVQQYKHRQWSV
jgi:hypothetical protein